MMQASPKSTRESKNSKANLVHPELAAALSKARGIAPPTQMSAADDLWPAIDDAAYYGLAGEVVRAIDPHTEADPIFRQHGWSKSTLSN